MKGFNPFRSNEKHYEKRIAELEATIKDRDNEIIRLKVRARLIDPPKPEKTVTEIWSDQVRDMVQRSWTIDALSKSPASVRQHEAEQRMRHYARIAGGVAAQQMDNSLAQVLMQKDTK